MLSVSVLVNSHKTSTRKEQSMEINFDVAFAENGSKSDISEDKWLLGWVEIVGGINGVPTAQQFNQFGYVFDKKANVAYSKANEAMVGLDNHSNDSTLHISATEREKWNNKANKTYVDEQLGNKADADHTHDTATSAVPGFMSAADKAKLDGISDSADSVSIVPALTAGTKIGTITINGVAVDLYCQTNTDTKYSPGAGIAISGTTISNSGVRSVTSGSTNGTISVNTGGTAANVAVKGLASAAYQAVQTAAGAVGLHRISSGTAAATTTNCPAGCWYGKHD